MNTFDVSFLGFEFTLNRVAFTIPIGDGFPVYWYGILIAIGFLLAIIYGIHFCKNFGLSSEKILDGVIIAAPISIICARLYYIIFNDNCDFSDFFKIHDGGIAIYGAVIGAVVTAIIYCRVRKLNIPSVLDIMAPAFLIGQAIGRWGNFVNQEAFGVNTTLPWGMYSNGTYSELLSVQSDLYLQGISVDPSLPVHPCFLYESLWCIIGFVIIHFLFVNRRRFAGEVALFYAVWYGIGRFFIEGLRIDSLMIGNIRVSQLLSAIIVIAAAIILIYNYRRLRFTREETYVPVFSELKKEISEDGENDEQNN